MKFVQVDAFAHRPFAGNQAVVMQLDGHAGAGPDGWPDDALLQAIANEHHVSETAFLIKAADDAADHELRWFTPAVEVALCGHATLAAGHVLLGESGQERIRFRTRKAGVLSVARTGRPDEYALELPGYPPAPKDWPALAAAMGGPIGHTLRHDGGYALLVYPDAADVVALAPDMAALKAEGDVLYIATAPGNGPRTRHPSGADVVSRVFAPVAGIDEDSATGSAHCVLACYWAERFGRESFSAYQASARGAHIGCTVAGDRVILTGGCVTTLEGRMLV